MNEEQNTILLLALFASLPLIRGKEQTKKLSLFRRNIRKKINSQFRLNYNDYTVYAKRASLLWTETVDELANEKLVISPYHLILSIHTLISNEPLTNKFYSEKQMDKVLNSIYETLDLNDDIFNSSEFAVNKIIDLFCKKLEIKRNNALKTRIWTLKQNLIIEGKI